MADLYKSTSTATAVRTPSETGYWKRRFGLVLDDVLRCVKGKCVTDLVCLTCGAAVRRSDWAEATRCRCGSRWCHDCLPLKGRLLCPACDRAERADRAEVRALEDAFRARLIKALSGVGV